jgi:2-C-methyl-D-erythritol 2,4-cyclodiphosphate synthase
VGIGYDVHRFCEGRALVLGGVQIPWPKGLEGHSDADVVVHAICDALLGAVGAGDIGRHFPDTDSRYAGISSLLLLQEVGSMVRQRGFRPLNVDATIVLEKPRLSEFIPSMVEAVAQALGLDPKRVNIKAKTAEGLGFVGAEEGVAAYAAASVESLSAGEEA